MDITDVIAARDVVRRHLPPTPTWTYPALNRVAGAEVHVKHENVQPVGAFKVRGGLTLLHAMSPDDRARGLVTYSTGNHAMSIAHAGALHGVSCTVVVPAGTDPSRVAALDAAGATVVLAGDDLDGAQHEAERIAAESGARVVSCGDTPELLPGVGTLYRELFEDRPHLDAVLVPVGSGTGAAAASVVARALSPRTEVIAVQSVSSPAAYDSWRSGEPVGRPNRTAVAGLATGRGYALTQSFLRAGLSDFLLVTDEQITVAQRLLATAAHTLAEGAGACALAAVLAFPDRFRNRRVAVVCSGGNAGAAELRALGA